MARNDDAMTDGSSPARDMNAYLEQLEDIPGTTVFTPSRSRQGYGLNQFCMSLIDAGNRADFLADEPAYLARWPMSDEARAAVLARDFNAMITQGGNIYFLAKIFATDGMTFQWAAARMTGMPQEDYAAMMLNGGRDPGGWRSKAERR